MPSELLVREGQGATLLIHEATMADDEVAMAFAKAHSTFSQAVAIGERCALFGVGVLFLNPFCSMNAKNILLTHFSARYPKMPPSALRLSVTSSEKQRPVLALAFDQARMRIGDMWKMNYYLPVIERSFLNEKVDLD
jgi:ribonuclease Z